MTGSRQEFPPPRRMSNLNALIAVGDREIDDFPEIAERLDQYLPDSRKVILPSVRHMFDPHAPGQFDREVRAFLQQQSR